MKNILKAALTNVYTTYLDIAGATGIITIYRYVFEEKNASIDDRTDYFNQILISNVGVQVQQNRLQRQNLICRKAQEEIIL